MDDRTIKKLKNNFQLLRDIVRQDKTIETKVDLSKIEKIINEKIPEELKKNAPSNFHELFTDFKLEYEKFKDFILYDKLIGKNIVALGGGFSSGKSSFLNALMGKNVLPSDINPSTSVPTYIVSGDKHNTQAVNVFDSKINMEVLAINQIAHGFGEIEDEDCEKVTDNVTLGHLLNSIFFSTPLHKYENIAFLDTPGYSKPDSAEYSARTDEQIARGQLNLSNFILWFIQADAGTITEEDIKFINTLRKDIPKLIILNKADKKNKQDIKDIISKIKDVLDMRGIQYEDVVAFSREEPEGYDSQKIKEHIENWNKVVYESSFARNFKVIFVKCREFYEKEIDEENRRLSRLNKAKTLVDDDTVVECLNSVITEIKKNLQALKDINQKLKELQNEFFTEIKFIGDIVGILMPEPSEIDLIQDKIQSPLQVIQEYKKKNGISTSNNYFDIIKEQFIDVENKINKQAGGSEYKNELFEVIKNNCEVEKEKVRFNDVLKNSEEYKKMLDKSLR